MGNEVRFFVVWATVFLAGEAIILQLGRALFPWSGPLGFAFTLAAGAYWLWAAFIYAVRRGYKLGAIDAAIVWQRRSTADSN